MKITYIILMAAVAAGLSMQCRGDVAPTPGGGRINPTFDESDLVCAGKVAGVEEVFRKLSQYGDKLPMTAIGESLTLETVRCYKGSAQQIVIRYVTHEPPERATDLVIAPGEELLVLLKASRDNTFVFAGPFGSKWDVALANLGPPGEGGLAQLERDLLLNLRRGRSAEALERNLELLHAINGLSDNALALVRGFFADPRPSVALRAFSVAMRLGKPPDLVAVTAYLQNNVDRLTDEQLLVCDFSPLQDAADPDALPPLEKLAKSRFLGIRGFAMEGIRHLRAPASIPDLIEHLDDTDPLTLYLAVITLSEITGRSGENAPSMAEFDQAPSKYIAAWKNWWASEGSAQYGRQ